MTSVAVVNISMKSPRVRFVPYPRATPTFNGPGVSPSKIAAATIAPTICAVAVTVDSAWRQARSGSFVLTDETQGLDNAAETQCEADARVHDRPGESVKNARDCEQRETKGGRDVVVTLGFFSFKSGKTG
jgi:hypothetical protein